MRNIEILKRNSSPTLPQHLEPHLGEVLASTQIEPHYYDLISNDFTLSDPFNISIRERDDDGIELLELIDWQVYSFVSLILPLFIFHNSCVVNPGSTTLCTKWSCLLL